MNKTTSIILLIVAIVVIAFVANNNKDAEPQTDMQEAAQVQEGDTLYMALEDSYVGWLGKKPGGEHFGKVTGVTGVVGINEEGMISSGAVEVDLNTITVEDIEDAEENKKLVDHLIADDFLSVVSFPTAAFEVIEFNSAEGNMNEGFIKGNLTIKETTMEISFPVTIAEEGDMMVVDGKRTLNRKDFDFGILPVSDEFEISFNLVLKKAEMDTDEDDHAGHDHEEGEDHSDEESVDESLEEKGLE